MTDSSLHVFISFKTEDNQFAKELVNKLSEVGIEAWKAPEGIKPSDIWLEAINRAIHDAFAMVVILTSDALKSQWITYEWSLALFQEKRIFPVKIKDFSDNDIHDKLRAIQYINLTNSDTYEQNIEILIHGLRQVRDQYKPQIPLDTPPSIRNAREGLNSRILAERKDALSNLAQIEHPLRAIALVEATQHEYPDVQINAASELAKLKDPRALPTILKFLYGNNWNFAEQAVYALADLGKEAVPAIWEALNHSNSKIRTYAARILGQAGFNTTVDSVPYLLTTVEKQNEEISVRKAAIVSLGEIKSPTSVAKLLNCLTDFESIIRFSVIETLGEIGDNRATKPLLMLFQKDKLDTIRKSIIEALSKIGDDEAVKALIEIIDDEDDYVRGLAIQKLNLLHNPIAIPRLIKALSDKDEEVRGYAAQALGNSGDPSVGPYLIDRLNNDSIWVQIAAANALENFPSQEAIEALAIFKDRFNSA